VPPTVATVGQAYQYAPTVTDPQNLPITLRLVSAPTGMTLGADRTLRWTQPAAGSFPVVIRADNGRAVADQQYNLAVTTGTQPLELGLTVTPVLATTGQAVAISAYANGGRGTVALQASVNAQPVTLDANGAGSFVAGPAGAYRVIVRATDANETLERQAVFTVGNTTDTTEPTALITTPTADAEVMAAVDVIGTASDANLAYYQLLLRPAGSTDADWKELARGNTNVANATLGRLNPTGLANGAYELALRVVDINNRIKSTTIPIEIARDLKLGQFRLSFADIRAESRGLPLMLSPAANLPATRPTSHKRSSLAKECVSRRSVLPAIRRFAREYRVVEWRPPAFSWL
jgi:hypothetical protein